MNIKLDSKLILYFLAGIRAAGKHGAASAVIDGEGYLLGILNLEVPENMSVFKFQWLAHPGLQLSDEDALPIQHGELWRRDTHVFMAPSWDDLELLEKTDYFIHVEELEAVLKETL